MAEDVVVTGALAASLARLLDEHEVTKLVLRMHALADRWRWSEIPVLCTENASMDMRIDNVPVIPPRPRTDVAVTPGTTWREQHNVRGQHQWADIAVEIDGDNAHVFMSGTQTNTFADGVSETSGILQEARCLRTVDGWRIDEMVGSYESRHERIEAIFADQLQGQTRGFRRETGASA